MEQRAINHTSVEVIAIPDCDLCIDSTSAYADAALPSYGGSWAYVCNDHFKLLRCSLGLGKGQELIIRKE